MIDIAGGIILALVVIAVACVVFYVLGWIGYLFIQVLSGMLGMLAYIPSEKSVSSPASATGVRRETVLALIMAFVVVGGIFLFLQYGPYD